MSVRDVYDPVDSQLWANLAKAWCNFTPDIVFTSESYGENWAKYLGCQHLLVDMDRATYPISGTKVRQNPIASWKYLPPATREFYCHRIVIVGSESTGKTTLSENLATRYHTIWVKEFGRELCERKLAQSKGKPNRLI
jgi:NadR type nicotinamide-nucleotide adenylyltransferase